MNNIEHHDTRYSMEGCFMDVIGYAILTDHLERYGASKQSDADAKLTLVMMQTAVDTLTTIKQTSDKTAIKFQEVNEKTESFKSLLDDVEPFASVDPEE